MLGGRLLLVEIIVLHLLEIDCEFGESFCDTVVRTGTLRTGLVRT